MFAGLRHAVTSFFSTSVHLQTFELAQTSFAIFRRFCSTMAKPVVFFDIKAGGQPVGRIVMEVS